jgi:hypothetical protein
MRVTVTGPTRKRKENFVTIFPEKLVPTLAVEGVAWSAQRIPTAVISVF